MMITRLKSKCLEVSPLFLFVLCSLFQNFLLSKLLPQQEKEAVSEIRRGAASLSVMDGAYIDESVSEDNKHTEWCLCGLCCL